MRRRELLGILGAATMMPLSARAQGERMRRIGVLMAEAADDPIVQARDTAFLKGLQALGWRVGGNVRIDHRFAPTSVEHSRRNAEELIALAPDVILATGGISVGPLLQLTRCIRSGHRSGGSGLCRKSGAAGRQRHRICSVRVRQ